LFDPQISAGPFVFLPAVLCFVPIIGFYVIYDNHKYQKYQRITCLLCKPYRCNNLQTYLPGWLCVEKWRSGRWTLPGGLERDVLFALSRRMVGQRQLAPCTMEIDNPGAVANV
jgi:hypothetical protein